MIIVILLSRVEIYFNEILLISHEIIKNVFLGARYHRNCFSHFCCKRNTPASRSSENQNAKKIKVGRKADETCQSAFQIIITHIKNNPDEQLTLKDLVTMMEDLLSDSDSEAYSSKYLKTKLEEYFKDEIIITSCDGKVNVITFRQKASSVLYDFFMENKNQNNTEDQKSALILAAAKLIKNDIQLIAANKTEFPDISDISICDSLNFVPASLNLYLENLIKQNSSELKKATTRLMLSFGQHNLGLCGDQRPPNWALGPV